MLAAELRGEVGRIDRSEAELARAERAAEGLSERLALYGITALLDTFYTDVEQALLRIARAFGGVPEGPAWHRALLEDMLLDVPQVRPAVLREETARDLERYLACRHRLRNLYLFELELERDLVMPLLRDAPSTWRRCREDLLGFAAKLDGMADALTG